MSIKYSTYAALLRGINVGGEAKVEMAKLRSVFEQAGLENVRTYINSGNVIFRDAGHTPVQLARILERAVEANFGLAAKVLIRDKANIHAVVKALPPHWENNTAMKCDVLFLWEDIANPRILQQIKVKPEIEDVKYAAGTLLWRTDRKNITKGSSVKLVKSDLYKKITIRSCNTVRKIYELMEDTDKST